MNKLLISLAVLLASEAAFAGYCDERKVIEHTFSTDEFKELRLNALAGDLFIDEVSGDDIQVEGVACTDKSKYLDRMTIDVEESGDVLELTVIIPYNDWDWYADYAHMDLTLKVPASLRHLIRDSSGDLEARGIHVIRIEDSSGNIRLRETTGDLSIQDSSGLISIREHTGSVELEDSSGDLDVSEIEGDVTVKRDSSGDIEIELVSGLVAIYRDSSGDIEIEQVGKSVSIGADGGGSIRIRDVKGSVEIGADGSGDVHIQTVNGDLTIRNKGSGNIRTSDVKGNIQIPD